MPWAARLPQPILVVAAHPDDEIAGLGGWIASLPTRRHVQFCFLTDGAPRSRRYWAADFRGSRAEYRRLRRHEARTVAAALQVPAAHLVFGPSVDLELFRGLRPAGALLSKLAARLKPATVLAPAYEGGHPDHDAANFLAAQIFAGRRRRPGPQLWEYCLYTAAHGRIEFLGPRGRGWRELKLSPRMQRGKQRALALYRSQSATLRQFPLTGEFIRPLPRRDYSCPALPEPPVWSAWGWRISTAEICRAFCHWQKVHGFADLHDSPAACA